MRVIYSVTAAVSVASVVAANESNFQKAYNELVGCHTHFGLCAFKGGATHLGKEDCSINPDFKYVELIESANELKRLSDSMPTAEKSIYMARLSESTFAEAMMAKASVESMLYCDKATYAFVQGKSPADLVDFEFVVPAALKTHFSVFLNVTDLPGQADEVTYTVKVAKSSHGKVSEVANRWESDVQSRRRLHGSNMVISAAKTMSGEERDVLFVSSANRDDIEFIAGKPETIFISPRLRSSLFNFDASQITQDKNIGTVEPLFNGDTFVSNPHKLQLHEKGITGKGQIVGVGDSGLDMSSCFFRDPSVDETANFELRLAANVTSGPKQFLYPNHRKVVQYVAFADGVEGEVGGHGTHVCGTVAGAVTSEETAVYALEGLRTSYHNASEFSGMAPEAKLALFDIGKPDERYLTVPDFLSEVVDPSYKIGARIHTNSWGGTYSGYFTENAELDDYLFKRQDLVVLFAAGNDGKFSLGYQGQTKNVLSVGASRASTRSFRFFKESTGYQSFWCNLTSPNNCADDMAAFSSSGPTFDGRIKPEVVAPGHYIYSANSVGDGSNQCSVVSMAGTSMATPVVAGNSALIRQFFTDGYYPSGSAVKADGFNPMGALIKAVLVDGAELMSGTYGSDTLISNKPNEVQGFGRVFLRNTLKVEGSWAKDTRHVFVDGDMAKMPMISRSKSEIKYIFNVEGNETLRATLVWYEHGASEVSLKALINNLDLKIVGPDGSSTFYPNGLSKPDNVNTVEKIEIPASKLKSGKYEVIVSAKKLNRDNQPFAIVISGDISLPDPAPEPTPASSATGALVGAIVGGTVLTIALIVVGIKFFKPTGSEEDLEKSGVVTVNPSRDF